MPWGYWTDERILAALLWWHDRHESWPSFPMWKRHGHDDYDAFLLPPATAVQRALGWQQAKDQAAAMLEGRLV